MFPDADPPSGARASRAANEADVAGATVRLTVPAGLARRAGERPARRSRPAATSTPLRFTRHAARGPRAPASWPRCVVSRSRGAGAVAGRDRSHPHIPMQTLLPPAAGQARARRRCAAGQADRLRDGPGRRGPRDPAPARLRGHAALRRRPRGRRPRRRSTRSSSACAPTTRGRAWRRPQARLLAYVEGGGTLVVQYNNDRDLVTDRLGPYPFTISRERVTDETAPVTVLAPDTRCSTTPNAIGGRGLRGLGAGARALLPRDRGTRATRRRSRCPTRARRRCDGSLLFARLGKGSFVYTGLAFFRQLPGRRARRVPPVREPARRRQAAWMTAPRAPESCCAAARARRPEPGADLPTSRRRSDARGSASTRSSRAPSRS